MTNYNVDSNIGRDSLRIVKIGQSAAKMLPISRNQSIKSKAIWADALQGLPDIPRRPRKERLSEKTVRFICEKLQDGVGPTEILKLNTSDAVTIDIISDIKRRRGYRHISCEYVW